MSEASRVIFLKGRRVILRPLREADLNRCERWINDPEVRRFVGGKFPFSEDQEREWFKDLKNRKDHILLAIETVGGEHIGNMSLMRINWVNGIATTGALIGEKEYRGKGYGTEAKMLLLGYAFNTLGLRKIYSYVVASNRRSYRYSEKCGYKKEAKLKQHILKNGRYYDMVILAVFKKDWQKARRKLRQTK